MSYKALVDSNVTLAFNLLKDLAVDAVLKKSSNQEFNFGTAEMVDDKTSYNIKAVVIEDDKKSDKHNSIKRQLLFKTRGLGDINAYDIISIPNDVNPSVLNDWKFGPMINNDGYTILAEIYREV